MANDLDDVFASFREHVDAIPAIPAATARHRGERLVRLRTATATAVAIFMIVGGIVVAAGRGLLGAGPFEVPAAPNHSAGELPLIGATIPLADNSSTSFALTATSDLSVAAWESTTGDLRLVGVDPRDGRVVWPARSLGRQTILGTAEVIPGAVVVNLDGPPGALLILDPASGRTRWQIPYEVADTRLYYRDRLVVMSESTGVTRAYDWTTGAVLWKTLPGQDRPVRTIGIASSADLRSTDWHGIEVFSGNRFLQVLKSGKVLMRDTQTGVPKNVTAYDDVYSTEGLIADNGSLYSTQAAAGTYGIRVTRLPDLSAPRSIYTAPAARSFRTAVLCGANRLCVLDDGADDQGTSQVAAIDLATSRELWRVSAPPGARSVTQRGDRLLVAGDGDGDRSALYDMSGRQILQDADRRAVLYWLSDEGLIYLPGMQGRKPPATASADVTVISSRDGRHVHSGTAGATSMCSFTPTRLACLQPQGLQVRSLEH
jgi:outer membrane protein assembly factor BamB